MRTLLIPLDQICLRRRLRAVDQAHVEFLAQSIADQGLMTPVEVWPTPGEEREYRLVAGAHRIEALRALGRTEVEATLCDGNELQARLREVDENLVRHELTELDRSTFLAARKELYLELYPETKHGGARGSKTTSLSSCSAPSFTQETAERLKITPRSVQRAVARYERLSREARLAASGTWLADSGAQLDAIARLDEPMQVIVAEVMVKHEGVRTVDAARALLDGREPPVVNRDDALFEGFLRRWKDYPVGVRRLVRAHVVASVDPSEEAV